MCFFDWEYTCRSIFSQTNNWQWKTIKKWSVRLKKFFSTIDKCKSRLFICAIKWCAHFVPKTVDFYIFSAWIELGLQSRSRIRFRFSCCFRLHFRLCSIDLTSVAKSCFRSRSQYFSISQLRGWLQKKYGKLGAWPHAKKKFPRIHLKTNNILI